MFKKILVFTALLISAILLSACQHKEADNVIKVGTMMGPETQLMETAKQVAAQKYNLDIDIVQFSDYTMPNEALADGSIDANMFQHMPYLQAAIKAKGYKLTVIGKTFVYPMGLYSTKIKKLSQIKNGAVVAIPNDPSNEARALLLLQRAGLIKLRANAGVNATLTDITSNPKSLKIKELDAAQLPRVLTDVTLAAINTNYAMLANLLPSRDALITENANSAYANIVVVRDGQQDEQKFKELMQALNSPAVLAEAQQLFKGQAIPAWKQSS